MNILTITLSHQQSATKLLTYSTCTYGTGMVDPKLDQASFLGLITYDVKMRKSDKSNLKFFSILYVLTIAYSNSAKIKKRF